MVLAVGFCVTPGTRSSFNSKGDNMRQVIFRIEFEAICCLNNDWLSALHIWEVQNAVCHV